MHRFKHPESSNLGISIHYLKTLQYHCGDSFLISGDSLSHLNMPSNFWRLSDIWRYPLLSEFPSDIWRLLLISGDTLSYLKTASDFWRHPLQSQFASNIWRLSLISKDIFWYLEILSRVFLRSLEICSDIQSFPLISGDCSLISEDCFQYLETLSGDFLRYLQFPSGIWRFLLKSGDSQIFGVFSFTWHLESAYDIWRLSQISGHYMYLWYLETPWQLHSWSYTELHPRSIYLV